MKRAGTPGSGRDQASARGTGKTSATAKPAKAAAPKKAAAAPKKTTGGRAPAASAKNVTSKTKSNPVAAALQAAKAVARTVKETVAKAAQRSTAKAKSAAKAATAPAQAAAKAVTKSARAAAGAAKPAAKAVSKAASKAIAKAAPKTAKKTVSKPSAPARTTSAAAKAPASAPSKNTPKSKSSVKPAAKVPAAKAKATSKPAPAAKVPALKPKAPSRTLRPKSFRELETARGFGFPAETPELPESYGEDTLVLMTKDPEYLFAYWDVTPERLERAARAKREGEAYREALRLTWTSSDLLEDSFALVPVSLDAKRWYLRVPFSGLSYSVEIGWLSEQGHFISLLGASNPSDAPEAWARTRERLREREAVLEYALSHAQPLGASDLAPQAAARRPVAWEFEGPGALSSSDAARPAGAAAEKKRP